VLSTGNWPRQCLDGSLLRFNLCCQGFSFPGLHTTHGSLLIFGSPCRCLVLALDLTLRFLLALATCHVAPGADSGSVLRCVPPVRSILCAHRCGSSFHLVTFANLCRLSCLQLARCSTRISFALARLVHTNCLMKCA
jgi:hypothetical protein